MNSKTTKLYKVFLLLIVISGSIQAQDLALKKHEIGLNLFSFTNASIFVSGGDSYFKYLPNYQFANGISYRHHFKKNVLRVGLSYQFKQFPNEKIVGNNDPNQLYHGKIWGVEAKLGIAHVFGSGKLKPFVALDGYFSIGENTGAPYYLDAPIFGIYIGPPTYRFISGGLSPALGLTYQVFKQFSFRVETSGNIGWYGQTRSTKGISELNGFYIMYNPVSTLSLNYHF